MHYYTSQFLPNMSKFISSVKALIIEVVVCLILQEIPNVLSSISQADRPRLFPDRVLLRLRPRLLLFLLHRQTDQTAQSHGKRGEDLRGRGGHWGHGRDGGGLWGHGSKVFQWSSGECAVIISSTGYDADHTTLLSGNLLIIKKGILHYRPWQSIKAHSRLVHFVWLAYMGSR